MFICQFCSESVGPRIKPLKTVFDFERYPVRYSNKVMDPETERTYIKETVGHEYLAEHDQCPTCSGIEQKASVPVDVKKATLVLRAMQGHARNCKKLLDECRYCKKNIMDFHSASPLLLSAALEDDMPKTFKTPLGIVAVENNISRSEQRSQRALRDVQACYDLIAPYVTAGGTV